MARNLLDDCFLHDEERLSHDQALAILTSRISPVVGIEHINVADAMGRILAEPISAPRPIPAHTNAAVDGYGFSHQDYDQQHGSRFCISGRAAAGHPAPEPIEEQTAVRIFTGAILPASLDTIVMQEDVDLEMQRESNWVLIPPGLKAGANVRPAGEDVPEGALLFKGGVKLRPQDLAAIAATGRQKLAVYKPLKIALVSTGDEIVRSVTEFKAGQVYDANFPMLRGLLATLGAEFMDLGILPDKAEAVRERLSAASGQFDVVLSSGGASRGEEDYIVKSINELGSLKLWQIAVKPGRPMSFGQIGNCVFAGLPGNPVAVFVCFLMYIRPLLITLSGGLWREPTRYQLRAAFSVNKKKTGRREFWRGSLEKGADGRLEVHKFERDGSGLISSLRKADGLIDVAEDVSHIDEGDMVNFIPFTEFGF